MRRFYDWKAIQAFIESGKSFDECQQHFGFSRNAWVKALAKGKLPPELRALGDGRRRPRVNWGEIQAYYDAGHSIRKCATKFGFCLASWHKACRRGDFKARPQGMPIEELLRRGVSRYNVKHRLLRAGLLPNHCQICGLSEWRNQPLSMHIDHINGVKNDHRLENLRMLCPNCHAQTETYGGRNAKRRRRLQDPGSTL